MVRLAAAALLLFFAARLSASEEDYYEIVTIPVPKEIKLEVGGLAALGDGRLAASTRRGEIWIIEGAYDRAPEDVSYRLFASGLHEALGLLMREDGLYAAQRSEVTRIRDTDGDGEADAYETVAKGWGVSGHYHEFVYGPKEDHEGNLWITINIPTSEQPKAHANPAWRGWGMKITPGGELIPVMGGMRSPSGLGLNAEGDVFYTDQQGNWMAAGPLFHMREGMFGGHPYGLASCDLPGSPLARPERIPTGKPRHVVKRELPELALPDLHSAPERRNS